MAFLFSDMETFELVFGALLDDLQIQAESGMTPLHLAAIRDGQPFIGKSARIGAGEVGRWLARSAPAAEAARFLVDQFPQSASEPTGEGYLPLHVAAMHGYAYGEEADRLELDFLRYLVRQAPTSVRVASNEFLFPFHYAISGSSNCSLPTVRFLLEQWPDALQYRDGDGSIALHMAIARDDPDMSIVRFLTDLRPQSLQETDRNGSAPLHAAVAQLQSPVHPHFDFRQRRDLQELVRYLMERRPESLMEADHRGFLPLHVAAAREVLALEAVRVLLEMRPDAVEVTDNHGCLPLHVSVARDTCSLELVQLLTEQSPASVRATNASGRLSLAPRRWVCCSSWSPRGRNPSTGAVLLTRCVVPGRTSAPSCARCRQEPPSATRASGFLTRPPPPWHRCICICRLVYVYSSICVAGAAVSLWRVCSTAHWQ
jgi:ankyrin repeat protein